MDRGVGLEEDPGLQHRYVHGVVLARSMRSEHSSPRGPQSDEFLGVIPIPTSTLPTEETCEWLPLQSRPMQVRSSYF